MEEFYLTDEYIELIKLLKYLDFAPTGGYAKMMVENGEVRLNDNIEFRKRAKLRPGDVVEVAERRVMIVKQD